jgi:hypothetical protein
MASRKRKPKIVRVVTANLGQPRMLRLSKDLEDRVHDYQRRLHDEFGITTGFSTILRTLIEHGLKASR